MKKLLILFIVTALFISCSNDNPFARKDGKKDRTDTETKKDNDKNGNEFKEGGNDDVNSGWSSSFRKKQNESCLDEYRDDANAKQICSCILGKMEQKFPDESEAKTVDEDDVDEVIEACEAKFRNGANEDDGYIKTVERNDVFEEPKKKWTSLQRQTFVQNCATVARQQPGFTPGQANSYCECMTRKVEQKFSFKDASRMTAADFQTQEWINAAAECRSGNN